MHPRAVQEGTLDPTFVITTRLPLEQASEAYKMFNNKAKGCIKVGGWAGGWMGGWVCKGWVTVGWQGERGMCGNTSPPTDLV